jgi:hypothetical protein
MYATARCTISPPPPFQDLEICDVPEPHLRVVLRGGKTDTDNQGFIRYVSPNSAEPLYCPVRLTEYSKTSFLVQIKFITQD